jgi:hypothetical protein
MTTLAMPVEEHMRKDTGQTRLTSRDVLALRWVAEQSVASIHDLQVVLGRQAQKPTKRAGELSYKTAYQVVVRWSKLGLVHYEAAGGFPLTIWVTRAGLGKLGLPYRPYTPSIGSLSHRYAVNLVRLTLERLRPADIWISERALRAERGVTAEKVPHLPDGVLSTGEGSVGVEVELTQKQKNRLLHIMHELVSHYNTIWYFVTRETRAVVEEVRSQLDTTLQPKILLYQLEEMKSWE